MTDKKKHLNESMEAYGKVVFEVKKDYEKMYPLDTPNDNSFHSILTGLFIDNSSGFRLHDFYPLLKTDTENIYIWTHTENHWSCLVSEVDQKIKESPYWKNFGYIFRLFYGYVCLFENDIDIGYLWLYYFHPEKEMEGPEFILGFDHDDLQRGTILKVSYFAKAPALIELLIRDDLFYIALSFLHDSLHCHWFCLTCELKQSGYIDHISHEPKKWEQAEMITKMETAIIQACKAVETILGKPSNANRHSRRNRTSQRWIRQIDLNPDDLYIKAGKSYLDYYYDLFEIRNSSAHGLGDISFELTRESAIKAQCFAFIILKEYYLKNALDDNAAMEGISFNRDFINMEEHFVETKETK